MLEKHIETYLVKKVKEVLKGVAYKFTSPNRRSVPDRLCVVHGKVFFVELKATGKKSTESQLREQDRLIALDQYVYTIDSKAKVDTLVMIWYRHLQEKGILE